MTSKPDLQLIIKKRGKIITTVDLTTLPTPGEYWWMAIDGGQKEVTTATKLGHRMREWLVKARKMK